MGRFLLLIDLPSDKESPDDVATKLEELRVLADDKDVKGVKHTGHQVLGSPGSPLAATDVIVVVQGERPDLDKFIAESGTDIQVVPLEISAETRDAFGQWRGGEGRG